MLTAWKDDLRLFLNSNLQFSSRDEYRYHEALVHPGLAATPSARNVLILGGGDGLALREVLRHPNVERVTLVDLDPEMTRLFSTHPDLRRLNHGALTDRRVTVVNDDAFTWLESEGQRFDFAVVDFPDSSNFSLGKLYTTTFYRMLRNRLAPDATFVVQASSPLFAPQSYWCIVATLEQARFAVAPYHVYVPSFGEWGFVLAGTRPRTSLRAPTRSAVPDPRDHSRDVRLSTGHGASAGRNQPPAHPGACPLLRARMGHDQSVTLLSRRGFLSAALVGLVQKSGRRIEGGFVNESHVPGHQLRDRVRFAEPRQTRTSPVVIVGGGIAGLSAAWRLGKRGMHDFVVLEMEPTAGGNARWGENEIAPFPWAAHYVPVPGRSAGLVRELFTDLGVFDGERWDERHLVHAPRERLFIHGRWQEGLDPTVGPTQRDRDQFARFDERIAQHRSTGRFTIPVSAGSDGSPPPIEDSLSMAAWLIASDWTRRGSVGLSTMPAATTMGRYRPMSPRGPASCTLPRARMNRTC